ncbi:MAG: polyprenyl synthetase family protein, partial [bacterium]|nr:polyprenyl synthetase family protein [bacterium]
MGFTNLGHAVSAREILELVHEDLQKVEREIAQESIASVDSVTSIGKYLQSSGGKRLRPMLLLLATKLIGE